MTPGGRAVRVVLPETIDTAILRAGLDRVDTAGRLDVVAVASFDESARRLVDGVADVAVVSPLAAARRLAASVLLPAAALSCRGPCPSLRLHLFARLPDVESCGSAAFGHPAEELARLTFESAGHRVPIEPFDGGADDALGTHDAVITVADTALGEETPEEATPIDLGAAWGVLSEEPFVWGVLAARPSAVDGALLDLLAAAPEAGLRDAPDLAARFAEEEGCSTDHALDYLVSRLAHRCDESVRRGVDALLEAVRRAGRLEAAGAPTWADEA